MAHPRCHRGELTRATSVTADASGRAAPQRQIPQSSATDRQPQRPPSKDRGVVGRRRLRRPTSLPRGTPEGRDRSPDPTRGTRRSTGTRQCRRWFRAAAGSSQSVAAWTRRIPCGVSPSRAYERQLMIDRRDRALDVFAGDPSANHERAGGERRIEAAVDVVGHTLALADAVAQTARRARTDPARCS